MVVGLAEAVSEVGEVAALEAVVLQVDGNKVASSQQSGIIKVNGEIIFSKEVYLCLKELRLHL